MGRALTAVGTLLVLAIGGFGLLVFLTSDEDTIAVDNLLAENLTRAIALAEQQSGGRVDLRRVAEFGWDEVVIVERGTSDEAIERRLGPTWTGELLFRTGELLLFLEDGELVRFADYRGEGTFEGFDGPFARIPREEAVLEVDDLVISPA